MFLFDRFILDVDRRQLRAGTDAVPLTPKAIDVLQMLVLRAPAVLSKEALLQQVWAGTFVNDGSLSTVIGELRAALGDDARHPRFIRTVNGVGYAFAGAVESADAETAGRARSSWRLVHGERVLLVKTGSIVVGRSDEAGLVLEVPGVSRRHARLTVTDECVVIEDLDSKNGTWVGLDRVTGLATVRDGDEIRFGPVVTTLRRAASSSSTETMRTPV